MVETKNTLVAYQFVRQVQTGLKRLLRVTNKTKGAFLGFIFWIRMLYKSAFEEKILFASQQLGLL